MRGSMIRHKFRMERFVHHNFNLPGSTMPMWPLWGFERRFPEARKKLAGKLMEYRRRFGRMNDATDYTLA